MTMITPSYLGETIEYSSLHACRSTLEDPTRKQPRNTASLYELSFLVSSSNTTAGKIETIGSKGVESELTFDKFDLSAYADLNAFGFPDGRNYAVIPMTAINIPEDAAGVRVEVGWDLTDIIERREGQTTADDDDIFVLKNNFWDGLSVKIVAE